MKKLLFGLASVFAFTAQVYACGDYSEEYDYYNLFNQSIINSPQYQPFLLTLDYPTYDTSSIDLKDEKIEDWANVLNISYENAYYLVYKASKKSIDDLTKTGKSKDVKLKFADSKFINKHKQSLLYLAYAKYLEPYMAHNFVGEKDSWSYYEYSDTNATKLNYKKVVDVLKRSYNAEKSTDLKLRYAYQLVRFAHYSNKYKDSINFFNQYVKPLQSTSVMYYYALDQKAGAERAVGNYIQANYDFFEVFSHTKNRKESAFNSMKVTQDLDYEQLLRKAKTDQEKLDVYLLIGYRDFSNPVAAMQKMIAINPNAEQAKVLFARAINLVERAYLVRDVNGYDWTDHKVNQGKLPVYNLNSYSFELNQQFLNQVIEIGKRQAKNSDEKAYWNLSLAYLSTISKDFSQAKSYLNQVNSNEKDYHLHKKMIEMFIDLNQQDRITSEFEQSIMAKYGDLLKFENNREEIGIEMNHLSDENRMKENFKEIAKDILANRYFLQGDKAKAFLIHNSILDLNANVTWELVNAIDALDKKSNKNEFEQFLTSNIEYYEYDYEKYENKKVVSQFKLADYINDYKGTLYLKERKFELAKAEFKKLPADFSFKISNGIFGYNKIECFNCPEKDVIVKPYLNEFKFFKNQMNKLELTDALIQLQQLAQQSNELGVKANYLLANFYYNTTELGYYRELLSFDSNNQNGPKFQNFVEKKDETKKADLTFINYYKDYGWRASQYISDYDLSLDYAKIGLAQVKNPELKAQLFFTAAKADQGKFYLYATNNKTDEEFWYVNYESPEFIAYKVKNHRNYFNQLKALSNTKTYQEIKSNCKYFDTYINL